MTQQDKELLLKDLCSRLPYDIKIEYNGDVRDMIGITLGRISISKTFYDKDVEDIKPYLFPLSSMTKEQRYELHDLIHNLNVLAINGEIGDWIVSSSEIDFYNKYHFDYRGLIEKGLAIEATGLNIY